MEVERIKHRDDSQPVIGVLGEAVRVDPSAARTREFERRRRLSGLEHV
jgi:hypothetical protein